jgi:ATP-dependent Zn protease
MNALNEFNTITTPMLERHLAIKQLTHSLHIQRSSVSTGDKQNHRRATDIIDQLTTEYGVEALRQAQAEFL